MATTIAVLSQKGGTGKTTLTRTLTDVFGRLGLDVLAIDADPQGNLSDYFDTDPQAATRRSPTCSRARCARPTRFTARWSRRTCDSPRPS